MPKSKSRGGKKQHRKRVQNRNKQIKDQENAFNKYKQDVFEKMMKDYEKQTIAANQSEESDDKIDGIDGPEI